MTIEDILKKGIDLAWYTLLVYWLWNARGNKVAIRTEGWMVQALLYWAPLVVAFLLLGPGDWFRHTWLREGIVPHTVPFFALAFVLVVSGAAVARRRSFLACCDCP
ncbi:hypothetical protein [Luteibacter sp. Lutesp34]|uniref:hypothetical protein n=1 Tax=Luteibacter sp. Lutesp34 TaxID=3243030 RepID=UPI0039B656D2